MNIEKEIKELLGELFKLIGIDVEVKVEEEVYKTEDGLESSAFKVLLDPKESAGLLIGTHGMTLTALQSFLSIALKQKTGDWVRVLVDIGNWNEKQSNRLKDLAHSACERVKQTGEEQRLYNLSASERRIIHMSLAEDKEIETFSEGEGRDRSLVIRLRK